MHELAPIPITTVGVRSVKSTVHEMAKTFMAYDSLQRTNNGFMTALTKEAFTHFTTLISNSLNGCGPNYFSPLLKDIMPVMVTPRMRFEVDIHTRYRNRLMGFAPEGGFAQQVGSNIETRSVVLSPVGQMFEMSLGVLATDEGKIEMVRQLMTLSEQFYQTLNVIAYQGIMRAAMDSVLLTRIVNEIEYLAAIRLDIENFGIANKMENGIGMMITQGLIAMQRANREIVVKYLIAPKDKVDMVMVQNRIVAAEKAGSDNAAQKLDDNKADMVIGGVTVVHAPRAIETEEWGRERTVGTYIPIMVRPGMETDEARFDVLMRRYNGDTGCYETVSLSEAFLNCGMFETGNLEGEGEEPNKPARQACVPGMFRLSEWGWKGHGDNVDVNPYPKSPFLYRNGNVWAVNPFAMRTHDMNTWLKPFAGIAPAIAFRDAGVDALGNLVPAIYAMPEVPAGAWRGISALAMNPHYRQRMSPCVLTCAGLGSTFQSEEVISQVNNSQVMMQQVGFRAHAASLVTNPQGMHMFWDAFYDGGIKGSNSKPIKPANRLGLPANEWKVASSQSPAMYYIVFPTYAFNGMSSTPNWVDDLDMVHLRGRNPFLTENDPEDYPGSASVSEHWGWDTLDQTGDVSDPNVHIARYCCLGSYEYFLANGTKVHVNGKSHHGFVENERGELVRRYGVTKVKQ